MTRKQIFAVIGVGSALYAVYRWTRRLEQAAEAYRRGGPRWDVVIPGAIALGMVFASVAQADSAIKKARRAF